MDPTIDPAFLRGLTQRRLSRRDLIRYAGVGAGALSLSSILAACGVKSSGAAGSQSAAGFDWASQSLHHQLNFANWPYYIDVNHGTHPTLDTFTQKTGIQVNYKPVINDNQAFYAKLKPSLEQGKPTGWDIVVITNGAQLSELIDNGWLIPLDLSKLPNFTANASPTIKDPTYDPGNKYTVVWQSGLTGIGFSPKATAALGREPNSLNDLFDPAVAGHVGMMSDNTELGSIGLLKLGIEPSTSTPDDWTQAAAVLQKQKDDGIPRGYFDQGYINQLENGNTWITQAWSGDIFIAQQSGYPELKFIVPNEGVMFWHDNMMIPVGAANPLDALTYMNYAYDPHVAALMANYIWYITPVPAAKPIVEALPGGKPVASSPLVFPDQAMLDKTHQYYVYKGTSDLDQWNNTFDPIITG
ncbi:MAG: spermidine/putrescine ABC transporter substrate-binding protein [Actinobacteria bacterium]|nr:MAG: spermidine/putrescine ABC transporter substrate-binding protein [Actinomycetota bacterium]